MRDEKDAKVGLSSQLSGSIISPRLGAPEKNYEGQGCKPAKKRKTSENGIAVITATMQSLSSVSLMSNGAQADENTPKGGRKSNMPFRRMDPFKMSHDVLVDNRYEAKV